MLNAQRAPRNIRMSVMTGVLHEHRTDSRTEYRTVIKEHMEAEATGNRYRLTLDYFDYLKLNGLWYLTGSRALDAQRSGYPVRIE